MTTWDQVQTYFLYKKRRKDTAHLRMDGDPNSVMKGDWKKKTFNCKICGSKMEYLYEDKMGDWVYGCTNEECIKSNDYRKKITREQIKWLKQQQMNSNLYYRNSMGGYY